MTTGPAREPPRARRAVLDLVRGLAALEVVAGHLRALMFAGADKESSFGWKLFILLTGQAHNAVIVFFVLSGFLVGRHVTERVEQDRWSWTAYGIRRLTRLWIVLVPALILTALLDAVGLHVLGGSLYLGQLDPAAYGASVPDAREMVENHGASTFVGNLLFLQNGILVAAYGVNGPLWSLANEFWYYVLFPLIYCAARWRAAAAATRWACAGLAAALCLALPAHVLVYGLVWLLGYLVAVAQPRRDRLLSARARRAAVAGASGALLASFYVVPRFVGLSLIGSDIVTALLFSTVLLLVSDGEIPSPVVARTASILSEMSYTLYLTHFPFMVLVLCALSDNGKYEPGPSSLALYLTLLGLSVAFAFAVSLPFERRTGVAQAWLLRTFRSRP